VAHKEQREFCNWVKRLHPQYFKNVRVADAGSLDVNGNNRYLFSGLFNRTKYLGFDIVPGKNVDVVGRVHDKLLQVSTDLSRQGNAFDVVLSTEMLEHDEFWEESLRVMYSVLRPGGLLLITAAGEGRKAHGTNDRDSWASPATNNYYRNITNAMILSKLTPDMFTTYHLGQDYRQRDLNFYGIKKALSIVNDKDKDQDAGLYGQHFPRVSIVIVNYNGRQWLELFMSRLLETQYPDYEVIIVDNASTDNSVQYLKDNFSDIQLVQLGDNKGYAEAANVGATYSSGEVLAFLNNDMEVKDDWLIKAIVRLTSEPIVAALQCKILRYDRRNEIDLIGLSVDRYNFFNAIGYGETDEGQYDTLDEIGACSGGAMIIWKGVFNEVGGFDSLYFMYYEDVDLCWRIRLAGYKICPAISSVVYHVGSASSNVRPSDKFTPSPFFAFLNSRNHVYCWLKNSSLKTIMIHWSPLFFGNLLVTLFLAASVSPRVGLAYFEGLFWPIKHLRYILNQRKKIEPIIKKREDNILYIDGIIQESSNLSNMVKKAPSVLREMVKKTGKKNIDARITSSFLMKADTH
jgi:GT2 family glycosyltransferase